VIYEFTSGISTWSGGVTDQLQLRPRIVRQETVAMNQSLITPVIASPCSTADHVRCRVGR